MERDSPTYEARVKNLLGRLRPRRSITRKTGGRYRRSEGFMTSLQANMITTPKAIRATALNQPMLSSWNGTVAGGSDKANLVCAKCQFPNSAPIITPAKATLSSKHGQESAGSG